MLIKKKRANFLLIFKSIAASLYVLPVVLSLNMLEPFLLSTKIRDFAPGELKNTMLGLITFTGLILAGISQPIIGSISDRLSSIFKRIAYVMTPGAIALMIVLILIVGSTNLLQVFIFYICFQISISAILGSGQTFIPLLIPRRFIGRASGIRSAIEILGAVVGVGLLVQMISHGYVMLSLLIILGTILFSIIVAGGTFFRKTVVVNPHSREKFDWNFDNFGAPHKVQIMKWWMINRGLFWMPIIGLRNLLIFYLEDVKGYPDPISSTSNIIAIMAITVFLVSVPSGYAADYLGRIPLLIIAGLASIIGIILLVLQQDQSLLLVSGVFMGCGMGIFISSSWALITDIIPKGHEGKALAIGNIATVVASASGRLWGVAIDFLNGLSSNNLGYTVALLFAIICFSGSIIALWPIRQLQIQNNNSLY